MTRSPPLASEATFLADILAYARSHSWLVFHDYHSRRNARGWPDLVLVHSGHLIIAELKSETGRLWPEQVLWLQMLADCGIQTHVWRPSDLASIIATFTRHVCSRIVPALVCLSRAPKLRA